MAQKFQSLKDEEIVRIAKGKILMTGASAYSEVAIDTQLSIERGVIWLIHAVEFFISLAALGEVAAGANENLQMHLARESKAAILEQDDADLIQRLDISINRSSTIGTDAGPLYYTGTMPKVFTYSPALPYAGQTLYFGVDSTGSGAQTGFIRARYTIRSVSDKYFFRVAQALLG